ncbi:hypothetical protein M0804_007058 [Polistes exclamans]|nr:hypothetical protein M0804_007058 [Polistes exclamans]
MCIIEKEKNKIETSSITKYDALDTAIITVANSKRLVMLHGVLNKNLFDCGTRLLECREASFGRTIFDLNQANVEIVSNYANSSTFWGNSVEMFAGWKGKTFSVVFETALFHTTGPWQARYAGGASVCELLSHNLCSKPESMLKCKRVH